MADPSEMLIHSNQSFPEGYFCCNPSLFISQPAKAPVFGDSALMVKGDQWDGFPAARRRFQNLLKANNDDANTVLLAGDIHASWVSEHSDPQKKLFEFTAPSISSSTLFQTIYGQLSSLLPREWPTLEETLRKTLGPVLMVKQPGIIDALGEVTNSPYSFASSNTTPDYQMYHKKVTGNCSQVLSSDCNQHGILMMEASAEALTAHYHLYDSDLISTSFYNNRRAFIDQYVSIRSYMINKTTDASDRHIMPC